MSERRAYRESLIRKFRDEIDADFKAGRIGIENGWLFYYVDLPAGHSCLGPYGCPPSCYTEPIMDLAQGVHFA